MNILTVYGHKGIVRPICHGVLQLEELLQILVVDVLLEVSGNGDFVTVGGRSVVSDSVVKLSETCDSDLQNRIFR